MFLSLSLSLVSRAPPSSSVRQDSADQLGVINLTRAGIDRLQQLIHLVLGHLLAQVGQDVLELTDADKAGHVLVEDLEAAAVLIRLAWVAEAARAVKDALECLEVDCDTVVLVLMPCLLHAV